VFFLSVETLLSLYLALLVFTRVDGIFLPGNELNVGFVPGAENKDEDAPSRRINVLLLGVDRRPQEDGAEPTRTDTILVATVDPASKTGAVLSIPRDLYVSIPLGPDNTFGDRINTAYVYGELQEYPGGGIALLKDTIERNLGIPIDHYVMVDFTSFQRVIDDLGGIDIEAEKEIYYQDYSDDDIHGRELYIPPGWQHMDGYTALAYARFRNDNEGDLGRIRRQQQVMIAAAEKALSLGWLNDAPSLWGSYQEAISTDVSTVKIPGYAVLARQLDLDALEYRSLGEIVNGQYAVDNGFTDDGKSVLFPDWDRIDMIVHQVFADPRLKQEAATIEMRNASGNPYLPFQVHEHLLLQGLREDALSTGNDVAPQARTTIYVSNGKSFTAQKLAEWLGLSAEQIVETQDPAQATDIVLVLGEDAHVPESLE
jgi:LCP family protein required for cell wall assembly